MKKIFACFKGSVILMFILLLLHSSCKKLNENPRGFASPDNFYTTLGQAEAALTGHMDRIYNYWDDPSYSWAWRLFTDDGQLGGGDLVIEADHGKDLYQAHYKGILNMNNLLRAIKDGKIKDATPEQIDLIAAQAKLLRGFDYFVLVRLFGDVPLYDENMEDPAVNPIARTPVAEVYKLIISDFTFAAQKLPITWSAAYKGRPSRGAAQGFLAKAYLTMATAPLNEVSNYAKARDAAKQCIDDNAHDLVPNIFDVFKVENKYSSEMLWSFDANYRDVAVEGQLFTSWETGIDGWGNVLADARFDTLWPEQPRKDAYLLRDVYEVSLADGTTKKYMLYVPDGATVISTLHYNDWGTQNPVIRKWIPPYTSQSDYDNYSSIYAVPIIRYADVLLIYAEAANMANGSPTQEACNALNRVIDRANDNSTGLPGHPRAVTSWTKQQFDDAVIQERSFELCFEFDRWYDICRKRILDSPLVTAPWKLRNFSQNDYLWPIPANQRKINYYN